MSIPKTYKKTKGYVSVSPSTLEWQRSVSPSTVMYQKRYIIDRTPLFFNKPLIRGLIWSGIAAIDSIHLEPKQCAGDRSDPLRRRFVVLSSRSRQVCVSRLNVYTARGPRLDPRSPTLEERGRVVSQIGERERERGAPEGGAGNLPHRAKGEHPWMPLFSSLSYSLESLLARCPLCCAVVKREITGHGWEP